MMASPYMRPFAEDVRAWEQRLSLVSEAIEARRARRAAPALAHSHKRPAMHTCRL